MHNCDPYIEETREEDCEFQASLCYVVSFFFSKEPHTLKSSKNTDICIFRSEVIEREDRKIGGCKGYVCGRRAGGGSDIGKDREVQFST